jgi:hypothetical protein
VELRSLPPAPAIQNAGSRIKRQTTRTPIKVIFGCIAIFVNQPILVVNMFSFDPPPFTNQSVNKGFRIIKFGSPSGTLDLGAKEKAAL